MLDPVSGFPIDPLAASPEADLFGKRYRFANAYNKYQFLNEGRVAYLSMEIGIQNEFPTGCK